MVQEWTGLGAGAARTTRRVRLALVARTEAAGGRERGDVPGWVLVTLMTAGLVSVLWFVAGDALVAVFQNAISTVTPSAP